MIVKKIITDIVVVDTGIENAFGKKNDVNGFFIDDNFKINEKYNDSIGHGTAVTDIILRHAKDAKIFMIKIFSKKNQLISESKLIYTLEYILKNIDCKIINLSLGINHVENMEKLYAICEKLVEKKLQFYLHLKIQMEYRIRPHLKM